MCKQAGAKTKFGVLILFIFCNSSDLTLSAQSIPEPIAKFDFNKGSLVNKVNGKPAKMVGAKHCEDRFGNKNNAVFLFGSDASYLNLGTGKELKPKVGSISMWVNIEAPILSGTGHTINPFILTKRTAADDFYESYIMCYHPEQQTFAAWCSKDSTKQISISGSEKVKLLEWHHLVITYDNDYFSFYVDAELQASLQKNYETSFLDTDSVLVGITGNAKNNRYMHGAVDDILFYPVVLSPAQIRALYHAPNPDRLSIFRDRILLVIFSALALYLIYLLIRWRIEKKMKQEREKLELKTRLLETELRVNRALMNPHFIFNSMNAIQDMILSGHNEEAGDYLIKFSKLVRKILESNSAEFISLATEIDILSRYLEIEELRFSKGFVYTIETEPGLMLDRIMIPIMMIQPFVENAVWHGLIKKEGEKILKISFKRQGEDHLLCQVEDNGIGRKPAQDTTNGEKKSMAIIFVQSRLELYNTLYNQKSKVEIVDKENGTGTIVRIILPFTYNEHFKSRTGRR